MATVWLNPVFKPFFKIIRDTVRQPTIDRTNFLADGFLQIIQRTGFVSVNTRFQIPQRKKSHVERSGERGSHGTSPKREMRHRETCFEQWSLTGLQCALWHHLVETTHWHSPPTPQPTEYYPFKRCQVPVGHPVFKITVLLQINDKALSFMFFWIEN